MRAALDATAPVEDRDSGTRRATRTTRLVRKPWYGAFCDTPLDTILRRLGRDTVIVIGTLTNCSCGTTARQAHERGYHVVFGFDLTATDDESRQEPELATLRNGFALVVSANEITAQLGHD